MKHLPNILTILRLFMVPLFVYEYFHAPMVAAVVFALACITDIADGYIARKYNVISVFGTLFDPAADKLLQISAMICLYVSKSIPLFVMIVVTAKEVIMMLAALLLFGKKIVIPSNKAGKIGTVIVSVMVLLFIALRPQLEKFTPILSFVFVITAASSLVSYFKVFLHEIKSKSSNNKTETM